MPGGASIPVTNDNAIAYIHHLANFRLNLQARVTACYAHPVYTHPVSGPHRDRRVSARHAAVDRSDVAAHVQRGGAADAHLRLQGRIFIHEELLMGCARACTRTHTSLQAEALDLDDLRRHVVYSGGYHDDHPVIHEFWRALQSMTPDEQRGLLRFVTSCSRPPLLGFRYLEPNMCIQVRACVCGAGVPRCATGVATTDGGERVGCDVGVAVAHICNVHEPAQAAALHVGSADQGKAAVCYRGGRRV